jgi:hypothetical protein
MKIHFAFDASGGFFALEDGNSVAAYAYAGSPNALAARECPEQVAERMITMRREFAMAEKARLLKSIEGPFMEQV